MADFIDLGEPSGVCGEVPGKRKKPEKYYPSFNLRKPVKGLMDVDQTAEITIKARVAGINKRRGQEPRYDIELLEMRTGSKKDAIRRRAGKR